MRKLYAEEPFDNIIKFELARVLVKFKDTLFEGRNYLLELLYTSNWTYAMLELGRLEASAGNYEESKSCFTALIYSDSQNKTYAMLELGKLEASVGNYEEAKSCFNELLETSDWIYGVENLLFLSIKEENYEEASQLLNTIYNANLIDDNQLSNIIYYLKYKLNLLTESDKKKNRNYFCSQLLDYSREEAINHIKAHFDENEFKNIHSVFLETIDIEKTLSFVEKSITESAPLQLSFVDKYNIDCGNIVGVNNDVETSFVEAVTFPNTKDIIAMYPVIGIKKKNLKNVGRRLVYNRKKS